MNFEAEGGPRAPDVHCVVTLDVPRGSLPELLELLLHQGHDDVVVNLKTFRNLAWTAKLRGSSPQAFAGDLMELVEAIMRARGATLDQVVPVLRALTAVLLPTKEEG